MLGILLGAATILASTDDTKSYDNCNNDYEVPFTCTDEWRGIHPFSYNPVTSGWTKDEDKEMGW